MDNQPTPRGRRIFTPEQRAEIVGRFRQSGLRQQEFVTQEGISLASLHKWLRSEHGPGQAKIDKAKFREVVFPVRGSAWQLEVVSPANWTVRLTQ
jgi:transposase-like protein